jgi:hypothetical protein
MLMMLMMSKRSRRKTTLLSAAEDAVLLSVNRKYQQIFGSQQPCARQTVNKCFFHQRGNNTPPKDFNVPKNCNMLWFQFSGGGFLSGVREIASVRKIVMKNFKRRHESIIGRNALLLANTSTPPPQQPEPWKESGSEVCSACKC